MCLEFTSVPFFCICSQILEAAKDPERKPVVVLGDATGHGIAPALSVTQMQAMLRMAFRLGADLPTAFRHVRGGLPSETPPWRNRREGG